MKKLFGLSTALIFIFSSCSKKCPEDISISFTSCVTDSAHVKPSLVGTWDFVKEINPYYTIWQCQIGGQLTYQFDSTGNYKYINNGTTLVQRHYYLRGELAAVLYDSISLNVEPNFCGGYMVLRQGGDTIDIYSKRN